MTGGASAADHGLVLVTEPRWVRVGHALLEALVLGVASFTVLHRVAVNLEWRAAPVGWAWLLVTSIGTLLLANRAALTPPASVREPLLPPSRRRHVPWVLLGFAAVTAVLAAVAPETSFRLVWVVGAITVAGALWWALVPTRPGRETPLPAARSGEHLAALLVCLGVAVFMLFVVNYSADDVYYVNRSVWVAERGAFPERDTMFGPEIYPVTYGGDVAVAVIEELFGTLAHVVGTAGATMVYLVANPVLVLGAGWATWRLVTLWAPRRRLLCFVVAVGVPIFAATGLIGDFGYARIWQGKVIAVALLAPLAWFHLTRLGRQETTPAARWWSVAMLAGTGVAWCGVTVTAPLFAPLLAAAAAAVAPALPSVRRHLLLGAVALAAAPLAVGVLTLLVDPDGPVAEETFATSEAVGWARVLGDDPVVTGLLVAGLVLGSMLVRRGAARGLAVASAALVFVATAPGVYELFEAVTGSGPVAPRLMLVAPFPVLVGMLATARLPTARPGSTLASMIPASAREHVGTATGVLVLALLATFGTPVWSGEFGASVTDRPAWKVDQQALADVRDVLAEDPGPGPVLLPAPTMRVLAVTTTRTFGVVPRTFYVPLLEEPAELHSHRVTLRRFVDDKRKDPTEARLADGLEGLGVTLACAERSNERHVEALAGTGYVHERRVGGLVCFDQPS